MGCKTGRDERANPGQPRPATRPGIFGCIDPEPQAPSIGLMAPVQKGSTAATHHSFLTARPCESPGGREINAEAGPGSASSQRSTPMSTRSSSPRRTSCRAALVALLALSSAALASLPGSALAADKAPAKEKSAGKASPSADRDTARRLVLEGDAFYDRREFARALERYSQAYGLMRVPTVGIEVIKAQTALGKLVEAQATAQEVASTPKKRGEPAVFEEARTRAAQSNLRVTGMIPSLWLEVSPPGVVFEVQIDGITPSTSPPYQLNPGPHKVRVQAKGYQARFLDIELREAERLNRRADLVADGPIPAKAVVAGAASAAGAGVASKSADAPSSPPGSAGASTAKTPTPGTAGTGTTSASTASKPASGEADLPAPTSSSPSTVADSKSSSAEPHARAEQPAAEPASVKEKPAAARQGSSTRTLGWVGLAVTGLAAGVGTYAGIKAFSSKPDCPDDTCTASQQDDIDSSERMGTVANVSVGLAVVTGALSIWALASSEDDDSKESASLYELPVTVSVGKLNEIRISGRF
ncbi:MAG: hypothetical protein RL033_1412 [Pseudomonadota bacterium]